MNPVRRTATNNTVSSTRLGRATLGVMGNPDGSRGSNGSLNNSQDISSPTQKPSSQKSFRVSFGKTISLSQFSNRDKPRFDIVPNEMICIQEATHKKHLSPERQFNIITNQPKASNSDSGATFTNVNGQSPINSMPQQPNGLDVASHRTNPF